MGRGGMHSNQQYRTWLALLQPSQPVPPCFTPFPRTQDSQTPVFHLMPASSPCPPNANCPPLLAVLPQDWWNAPTLGEYWKLWNMPVHKWLLRHVYFPAVRAGLSRFWAVIATFFVSAVFHEVRA